MPDNDDREPAETIPERVLALAAHPDDLDFGASGSVARWVKGGAEVTYLIVTRGDQGGFDETPREEMPRIREKEQRDAAAAVGVGDVRFLDGYRDGWLEPTPDLVRDVVRGIRAVRPTRMLIPSPERNWERIGAGHPDHLATGEAGIRAVYPAARNPFAFPELLADEGLEPWAVPEVWLMAHHTPDTWIDVTDTVELKIAALRAHVSQTAHNEGLEDLIRNWGAATATRGGLPEGRYAEAFKAVNTA